MKKLIIAVGTMLSVTSVSANVVWTNVGDSYVGSNGQSYTRVGDSYVGTNGQGYSRVGDTYVGTNGTTATQMGGQTIIRNADGSLRGSCSQVYGSVVCN